MATYLKVDTTQMKRTSQEYLRAIKDLEVARDSLEESIRVLQASGWKSQASEAYFKQYDDKWKKSIENQIVVLNHLHDSLEQAIADYEGLIDDAAQLANTLL